MNKEELIQDYIANRLSEKDKLRVEALLETDLELKEMYTTHKEVAAAFQISKSNEIKKRLQELDATETSSGGNNFMQGKFRRIAVAAVVIFGLFYMMTLLRSSDDIFESYFEVCPNTYLPVTRGNTIKNLQFEAFKTYESNNFVASELAFYELLKTTADPNIKFYYAMSLLNQNKFDSALEQLNSLHKERFEYQVESLWYAALIQLKKNNTESAKKHLTYIQQLNSNFKSDEIKSILDSF
jgi:hypothetical protein